MEDSCPATPLVLTGRDSKSPLQVAISSPESDGMKSPSRDSPDSVCVICLGRLKNKSFTDSCLHQFCFQCLLQWSKVKPECPLCKQPFKSIIHNVRSNLDYDQYHVGHGEPRCVLSDFMHSYNLNLIPLDRRFRYRSTMTPEYFRELAESFLAHTRRLSEDNYQIRPLVPADPAPAPNVRRSNRLQNNFMQRLRRHRGTSDFRRIIYLQDLWVQDLADISGRYRECTPQFYRDNPAQIHRIIPWLNREINVLLNDCESHVAAYLHTQIVSILPQHSIRSREFRELVEPYFGDRTDHFIHELYTFAHSVYDIAGFDQNAVYGMNTNYATEVQEISSSSDDSDIEVLETVGQEEKKSKKTPKHGFKTLVKRGCKEVIEVKQDEPVAGPSGINSAGPSEPIEICESDPDDIKVLDYVKPEPEVVTLSSGEEAAAFSDLDASGGEYAEVYNGEASKRISRSRSISEERSCRRKGRKGKCKSNGFGLKGRQKQKYIKSKNRSSSRTSSRTSSHINSRASSSSSSTSSHGSSRSSSSSSSSSNSSSCKSGSDYSNRRCISVSSVGSNSSEYTPYSKPKRKKSKVSRKKCKKRSSKHKLAESRRNRESNDTDKNVTKRKVKSCVIVPDSRSRDFPYASGVSGIQYRNEPPVSLASYWSIASNPEKDTSYFRPKYRKSVKSKRRYSSEGKSLKRTREFSSSSESSVYRSRKNESWSERLSESPTRNNPSSTSVGTSDVIFSPSSSLRSY